MAGPQNNFNAIKNRSTIFAPDGTEVTTNRLNAIDLVRTSGYRWKREDVGVERTESEGPVEYFNADVVTVHDPDGNPVQMKRSNAREIVATGKYTWHAPIGSKAATEAADAVLKAAEAVDKVEKSVAVAPEVIPPGESLTDEAIRVSGDADVAKYLDGFSLEALKQIADERYRETIHHRASKDTAILKIVEFEEAAQTT